MNNQLAQQSTIKAVSFAGTTRATPQIRLVIQLIKESVEQQRPITKEDIIRIYIDWRLTTRNSTLSLEKFSHTEPKYNEYWKKIMDYSVYKYFEVSREEYAKNYKTANLARAWFKNNLASAIIKGKLLVIPIIDIE